MIYDLSQFEHDIMSNDDSFVSVEKSYRYFKHFRIVYLNVYIVFVVNVNKNKIRIFTPIFDQNGCKPHLITLNQLHAFVKAYS